MVWLPYIPSRTFVLVGPPCAGLRGMIKGLNGTADYEDWKGIQTADFSTSGHTAMPLDWLDLAGRTVNTVFSGGGPLIYWLTHCIALLCVEMIGVDGAGE